MAKQSSVGPSRSGDQFHYQWAARQCLGLISGADGLAAVAIEGPSLDEGDASTSVGDEVIDVGLYYGNEDVIAANSIRYIQLKHSSKHAHDPWTASGLKRTIEGFAGRFKKLEASLGLDVLVKKVRFIFPTNRPAAGLSNRLWPKLEEFTPSILAILTQLAWLFRWAFVRERPPGSRW